MTVLLDTDAVLEQGVRALSARDPVMARIVAEGAVPILRKREPGFEGLAGIIVSQQLSTASAAAIWARVVERLPQPTPQAIIASSDETLRAVGLSGPKIRALRAVAEVVASGALPLERLHEHTAEEASRVMTAVKGIGPWTADIYLLFCLGHPDAFPAGDLAVQEAARIAYGLAVRPNDKAFIALAEPWRPWRGVAAKILWAYYRIAKAREGAPVSAS